MFYGPGQRTEKVMKYEVNSDPNIIWSYRNILEKVEKTWCTTKYLEATWRGEETCYYSSLCEKQHEIICTNESFRKLKIKIINCRKNLKGSGEGTKRTNFL